MSSCLTSNPACLAETHESVVASVLSRGVESFSERRRVCCLRCSRTICSALTKLCRVRSKRKFGIPFKGVSRICTQIWQMQYRSVPCTLAFVHAAQMSEQEADRSHHPAGDVGARALRQSMRVWCRVCNDHVSFHVEDTRHTTTSALRYAVYSVGMYADVDALQTRLGEHVGSSAQQVANHSSVLQGVHHTCLCIHDRIANYQSCRRNCKIRLLCKCS